MDHTFWRSRWTEGRIGFHEGTPNRFLSRHADWLAGCRRILVPLCGKTEDLAYLVGHGHEVVGVELVEDAVRQFFAEHAATPAITARDGFSIYSAGAITVLAGDLFATTPALVGTIDGIYDRAALIALPPDLRRRYIAHLGTIAPTAIRELLVCLDGPTMNGPENSGSDEGPPFSVSEAEVRAHFAGRAVTLVDQAPDPRGRAGWFERCYTIALSAG